MAIEPITGNQHFHAALVKLAGPFWGKPRVAALLRAFIRQVQILEDATWEVMNAYHVDTADSARLEVLGRVVGQSRFDFTDAEYRAVLRAKIAANKSRTRTDDIINVMHLAASASGQVQVNHYSPATAAVLPFESYSEAAITALVFLLPRTRAAGVQMHVFFSHIANGTYDYESTGIDLDNTITPGSVAPGLFDVRIL